MYIHDSESDVTLQYTPSVRMFILYIHVLVNTVHVYKYLFVLGVYVHVCVFVYV